MNLLKSFIFKRDYNLLNFTKGQQKNIDCVTHFYLPWSADTDHDLMYKYKNLLKECGELNIQFPKLPSLDEREIKDQLSQGIETHLIMSNLNSIHIFRVVEIKEIDDKIFDLIVDDIFVQLGGFYESQDKVQSELELLISNSGQRSIFYQWEGLNDKVTFENTEKWVLTDRSLTHEYFFKGMELEDRAFGKSWKNLFKASRHEIVLSALKRDQTKIDNTYKQFLSLEESFTHYLNAVTYELNDIYIYSLITEVRKKGALHKQWTKILSSPTYKDINQLMNKIMSKNEMSFSIQEISHYLKSAKSFIFSLKSEFRKKIFDEEYLRIETFLEENSTFISSFFTKGFDQRLGKLLEVNHWIQSNTAHAMNCSVQDLSSINLKLQRILDSLLGPDFQNNLVLNLCWEKIAEVRLSSQSLENELKTLLREDLSEVTPKKDTKKIG